MEEGGIGQVRNVPIGNLPPIPPGLESLYSACRRIYPDQPNPLQVTALTKYWLGGPDPLDYISMYANPGVPDQNIPAHWHYISFGLSDIHGDGRVHEVTGPESKSGFGFELSFRLKKEPGETAPPTWPAVVMQTLAKYVFHSGNNFCAGDHVSWHRALDNSVSRIQHMLMTDDPQLGAVNTLFGSVQFVQIVGVCKEELEAAQRWNGPGVIEILRRLPGAGGPWLITDMRRGESMLELDPSVHEEVKQGFETEGSNLSGVSARCSWVDMDIEQFLAGHGVKGPGCESGGFISDTEKDKRLPQISEIESHQIKTALKKGLLNTKAPLPPIKSSDPHTHLNESDHGCRKESYDSNTSTEMAMLESTELLRTKKLDGVHLTFNLESGILLPLAIRGRVKHGRHFTFKSVLGETAITLVAPTVTGTFVDTDHPYAAHGPWLQVLISEGFAQEISSDFEVLNNPEELILPKTFVWPEQKLAITIVADRF